MGGSQFLDDGLTLLKGADQVIEALLTTLSCGCSTDLYLLVGMDTHTATAGRDGRRREGTIDIIALEDDVASLADDRRSRTDHMLLTVDARIFGRLADVGGTDFYLSATANALKAHLRTPHNDC